jgi:site-specific DNA recombinase
VDGCEFRDGCHKALVERSIFHEVQNSLALRRTRPPGRGRRTIPWLLRGLVRCGGCGRVLSTHTVQHGSIIYCYYRCRSTAGGRDPCKGVLVSAGEIDHAVLEAAGVKDKWLTSKEQDAAVRGVIRQIVYKADTQRIEIEF